jgi:hypothetical protein
LAISFSIHQTDVVGADAFLTAIAASLIAGCKSSAVRFALETCLLSWAFPATIHVCCPAAMGALFAFARKTGPAFHRLVPVAAPSAATLGGFGLHVKISGGILDRGGSREGGSGGPGSGPHRSLRHIRSASLGKKLSCKIICCELSFM